MSFLFASTPEPISTTAKKHQRELRKEIRHIQIEENKNQASDKELEAVLRKHAKNNNIHECKKYSIQLIRLRNQRRNLNSVRMQLEAIDNQITGMKGMEMMTHTMGIASRLTQSLNMEFSTCGVATKTANMVAQQSLLKQNTQMMEKSMNEVFKNENEEDESVELVNGLLAELGLELELKMDSYAMSIQNCGRMGAEKNNDSYDTDSIEERFEKLKKTSAS